MKKLKNTGETIDIDARLPALRALLRSTPGLVASYLYGSYGTPYQTPLSDVDIAVVFAGGSEPTLEKELALTGHVVQTLAEEDVSVTVLNRAPVVFQYQVLATGRLLTCRDPVALADFVERVLSRYGDYSIDYRAFLDEYDETLVREYSHG